MVCTRFAFCTRKTDTGVGINIDIDNAMCIDINIDTGTGIRMDMDINMDVNLRRTDGHKYGYCGDDKDMDVFLGTCLQYKSL